MVCLFSGERGRGLLICANVIFFLGSGSAFLSKVINFFGIAVALFVIGNVYGWAADDTVIKRTVKCKYCRKRISEKVRVLFLG